MTKVGIITLHRNTNYGANLQAFALQKYIQSMGYEVQLVDYLKPEFDSQNHLCAWLHESWKNSHDSSFTHKLKLFLALCLSIPSKKRRLRLFDEFRNLHCKLSKQCDNAYDIMNLGIDTLVCGSDQIWNPDITHGFDPVYFGEVDGVKKSLAYAASVGKIQLNAEQKKIIVKYLQAMDYCSVREAESAKYLGTISGRKISTVCDPTFLLNIQDYLALTGRCLVKEKYVLLYSVIHNPQMSTFAERFAQEHGLALVEICQGKKRGTRYPQFSSWGPIEFLTAYRDAEFVITNSFHGTAFSLIFEKQFLVFDNKERGTRISNLLTSLGLQRRMLDSTNSVYNEEKIQYESVRERLAAYASLSKEYLAQALNVQLTALIPAVRCIGCGACKAVCPFGALALHADENGFLTAFVDNGKCKKCGQCKSVCPVLNPVKLSEARDVYAFKANDALRQNSASGGAFAAMASVVLKDKGVVYGATMKDDFSVEHVRIDSLTGLERIQGTKYTQSDISSCFCLIKSDLMAGKAVLFGGTACQIAAVKKYVESMKLPSDNLYLVDIICHGVASPSMFKRFIHWLGIQYKCPVKSYAFRNKSISWRGNSCMTTLTDGRFFKCDKFSSAFMNMYYSSVITRDSCFECPYTSTKRCSDLTIGDYWGIENLKTTFEDSLGVSVVLENSAKGKELFSHLEGTFLSGCLTSCNQPQLHHPVILPNHKEDILHNYREDFGKTINKNALPKGGILRSVFNHLFF